MKLLQYFHRNKPKMNIAPLETLEKSQLNDTTETESA